MFQCQHSSSNIDYCLGTVPTTGSQANSLHSMDIVFDHRVNMPSHESYWLVYVLFQLTITNLFARGLGRLVSFDHNSLFTRFILPTTHTNIVSIVLYHLISTTSLQDLSTMCYTHLAPKRPSYEKLGQCSSGTIASIQFY